jgi:uncharacterized protein with GYD domain
MAEREAIYKLKFLVDKGGQQESIRAIDALAKEFADVDENAQAVGQSAQVAAQKIAAFAQGRANLESTADAAKQVAINSDEIGTALDLGIEKLRTTADAAKEVAVSAEEMGAAIDDATQNADNLGNRLEDAKSNFKDVSSNVNLAGQFSRGTGAIRQLSQTAGLGGVSQGIGIGSDVALLARDLPKLKVALQGMPDIAKAAYSEIGGAGVGLIGALAALAIVTALAAKQTKEQKAAQDARFAGEKEVADFLRNATTDEAVAKQKELSDAVEEHQKRITELKAQYEAGTAAVEKAVPVFGKLAVVASENNLPGAVGQIQSYNEEIDKSETELAKAQTSYDLLTQAIEGGATAANDTAAAFAGLKDAASQQFVGDFERQQKERQLALASSSEDINKMVEDNTATMGGLVTLLNQLGSIADPTEAVTAQIKTYEDQLQGLIKDNEGLTYSVLPLIEAREHEASAIDATKSALDNLNSGFAHQEDVVKNRIAQLKEQAKEEIDFNKFLKSANAESVQARVEALQEEQAALQANLPELERMAKTSTSAAKEFKDTTDRLSEIDAELQKIGSQGVIAAIQHEQEQLTAEIIKIEAARDEKIAQIRAQAAQKELDLFQDLQKGLAEAVAKAAEDRADAQRDYIEKSADIEDDLAKKRLDIQKKFGRSLKQAIDDRDALAEYQAKQTRDDDLSDAEDAAQEQRQTLQKEYQKQLETIDRELAKQQQTLQAKYNQELSDLRTATANSINLERQKAQGEINEKQQAYRQELALLQSFAQNGVSTISAFAQSSTASLVQFSSEAQVVLAGFVSQANSILGGLLSGASSSSAPPPTPSPVPLPPPMHGPQPLPFSGEGGGLNIRIEGYTKTQIHAQLNEVLKLIMD